MKKLIFLLMTFTIVQTGFAQNAEKLVKKTVETFVKAGDTQDGAQLETILHPSFRVVLNQQMGSTETSTLDRETYVGLVNGKKIGGDKRKVSFDHIAVQGKNATVISTFTGEKATFHSTLLLVQGMDGKWMIVQDFPDIVAAGK